MIRRDLGGFEETYKMYCSSGLDINMERGWPCKEQLDLSMPMLDLVTSQSDLIRENDYRGYAGTGGIEPIKRIFSEFLDVDNRQLYIGSTMSTTIMYDIVAKAMFLGVNGNKPWKETGEVKFICPSPGYEKHYKICESFGITMLPVSMKDDGPDMNQVGELVKDPCVKGIWCVPLYSNPTGAVYSDEVIQMLASMKTAADDFTIFWDNAYVVHHLTDEEIRIRNIVKECEKYGNPNRVFEFFSTSKITFPGGGVAGCAASAENIVWLEKSSIIQLKTGDKINQLRHALFLKDKSGVLAHMKKHRDIIEPKFCLVDEMLKEHFEGTELVKWVKPKGGYFVSLELQNGMADKIYTICKNHGVKITPAGSTFPYGKDPDNKYIRLAPTYPAYEDLQKAMIVLCGSVKEAYGMI